MMRRTFLFLTVLSIFTISGVKAQLVQKSADCSGFHNENCQPGEEPWSENGQSKSALFYKGQTSNLNFVTYAEHDYRISICKQEIFSEDIQFKLLSGTGKVLYNNVNNDNSQTFEFTCTNSRRLEIEVTVPGGETKSDKLKSREMGCIGVLIEHMPSRDTGF